MATVPDQCRLVLNAASFATRAHHGQIRKDQVTPYVSHVFRVCLVVRDVFGIHDPRMLIAALLHDTIEDTNTDFDDIEKHFGQEIAGWVSFLTKNKALPESDREADYTRRLAQAPWQVQVCKLADIFDNMIDLPNMPQERRPHSLKRAEYYLNALSIQPAAEMQKPLALVSQLLSEMKAKL
jgi:guanosine-3',5'-bis(diphosphate) 3'-pyrophosphohydrolase